MNKKFSLPRGTSDILPIDVTLWGSIENLIRQKLNQYNYKEIRTPIFEETELFARSMGQSSEVVAKQMLSLTRSDADNKEKSGLSLRPEGTAAVVRSYIQNGMFKQEGLSRLFYFGPMFRGERPQKGRLRQFHQMGVEAIGPNSASPYLDAEVIALAVNVLKSLGLNNFQLKINTLGTAKDKGVFARWLKERLKDCIDHLSEASQQSFHENVFRILDSKEPEAQKLIDSLHLDHSYLSDESRTYYAQVKNALDILNVPYQETPRLVRGLDYYTQTVFEISDASLGSQDALGAGGRYGGLVQQLGGPEDVEAVGFALGIERIILALGDQERSPSVLDIFIMAMEEGFLDHAYALLHQLRDQFPQHSVEMNYNVSSMKSQLRLANKKNARFVLIIGKDEAESNAVTVKNMSTGDQRTMSMDHHMQGLKDFLKNN
ncbi:MAG: histidine--tRNA ligase [Candidatus Omnitrophica bacterium]|nr:histidine--tRNA ligase [Candidatus Omnitrophota bacterium]